MTFIVGLNCIDGLVLCSDSLETDGYNKTVVQKIFKYEVANEWGLAFGCSGTGAACTNFSDRLLELIDDKESYDRRGIEKLIEATMTYMRGEYPGESLDVVLGLWGNTPPETRLYRSQSNIQCLSIEAHYVCAGLDVSLARFLLDSIFSDDVTVGDGLHLATFVTSVMKEKADGVGGPTQMFFYPIGKAKWMEGNKESIAELERRQFSFADLERSVKQYCWSRSPHKFRPEQT